MKNGSILDELDVITTCQEVVADILGAVPEGMCSTQKLAILMRYLQEQQQRAIQQLTR